MNQPDFLHALPAEAIAIATVVAERSAADAEIANQILTEVRGEPITATETMPTELDIGWIALNMLATGDPTIPDSLREQLAPASEYGTDADYQEEIDAWADFGVTLDVETARRFRTLADTFPDKELSMDALHALGQARTLAAVREVATERGMDPVAVYSNDDLYYEAVRSAVTPEDDAAVHVLYLNGIDAEIEDQQRDTDTLRLLSEVIADDPEQQALLEQIKPEDHLDEVSELVAGPDVDMFRETMRQVALHSLTATWGPNIMDRLPIGQQAVLQPRITNLPTIQNLRQTQAAKFFAGVRVAVGL